MTDDPRAESQYQKCLEEATEYGKAGQNEQAEKSFQALTAEYPEKFGAWWAYAGYHMERQMAKEPLPPYREIDLESTMLTRALQIADNSQKLFVKKKIAEYKEAWLEKCGITRQAIREKMKRFSSFESFAEQLQDGYVSIAVCYDILPEFVSEGKTYSDEMEAAGRFKLLRHGRKELYFQKISDLHSRKPEVVKYTFTGWDEQNYRLTGLYDTADFELYVKCCDGESLELVYAYMAGKLHKHMLIKFQKAEPEPARGFWGALKKR